ncbi:MAG: NUDIX domain-containing protein [Pseudomonadota bacterium]
MENLTHVWRPRREIRALALGLPFRKGKLLVSAVTEDNGDIKGWRPLGGGVEFGEAAEVAVLRELREELKATAQILCRLGIFENIYTHQGETGHEVVFAFEVHLTDPGIAEAERFVVEDGPFRDLAAWVPVAEFLAGNKMLLPDGLLPLVPADRSA